MSAPILFNSKTPEWAWLSNFWPAPITDRHGRVWPSTEYLYQGMKSTDWDEQEKFRRCVSPKQAKFFSYRVVHRRPNWSEIKLDFMRRMTRLKYQQHPELREKLLATGDRELIHQVFWDDTFWGVRDGVGQNWQGRIIMEIREELRREI